MWEPLTRSVIELLIKLVVSQKKAVIPKREHVRKLSRISLLANMQYHTTFSIGLIRMWLLAILDF
ncbi:hypothetical protein BB347_15350 [Natronorubrum daqingense]|uniref:Transposase DDE domain-containing protein n=1 Tax=Natronorubrum daqingense TaxID=588898 RepID=A0A1P8RGV1_9EURY|nr:hypothetical protein BB347_15350 [Natronorubrum daqingense]